MRAFKKLIVFVLLLAVIAVPVAAAANLQAIEDWAKLHNYSPPAEIAKLVSEDTMTDKAQHLFYINHPELIGDKTQFRQACKQSEQTIVLGCYHSLEAGIAIYNVQKVNSLVDQYNQLAYTQESLYNSLDTRIQTQTTQ
jgi:hypothetical protein